MASCNLVRFSAHRHNGGQLSPQGLRALAAGVELTDAPPQPGGLERIRHLAVARSARPCQICGFVVLFKSLDWHKSLKGECVRPGTPLSLDDARRLVRGYVDHYNNVRLNSATGYITPKDMMAGGQQEIHGERDRKLEAARKQRQIRRH
jgi:hypothetical protein